VTERAPAPGSAPAAPAAAGGDALVRRFEIRNQYGIHARPAALLVKTASGFRADITIRNGPVAVSAKSIMGLLTIEGYQGVVLEVSARGPDAGAALDAIGELFEKKFFED